MTKVLITGCHGFIGRSFGLRAALRGWQVTGVSRAPDPPPDWPGDYHRLDVIEDDLAAILELYHPDLVLHGAGSASVGDSFSAPLLDLRSSVTTFASVLEAARLAASPPLVIFPSSAAVYGNTAGAALSETHPVNPISPYGFHKVTCELLAQEYRQCFGVRCMVVRVFSTFGPLQRKLLLW
jgi:UDP-glucose 4-epimerase